MIEIRVARGWSCVGAMRAEARAEVVKISAKKQAADTSIRRQFSLHERSTRLLRHYRDAAGLLRIWLAVRVTGRDARNYKFTAVSVFSSLKRSAMPSRGVTYLRRHC